MIALLAWWWCTVTRSDSKFDWQLLSQCVRQRSQSQARSYQISDVTGSVIAMLAWWWCSATGSDSKFDWQLLSQCVRQRSQNQARSYQISGVTESVIALLAWWWCTVTGVTQQVWLAASISVCKTTDWKPSQVLPDIWRYRVSDSTVGLVMVYCYRGDTASLIGSFCISV